MSTHRLDPFQTLIRDTAFIKDQIQLLLRLVGDGKVVRDPSIAGFCARKGISRSMYNKLRRAGKGPRELAAGQRRTISETAEADWDREREAEAEAKTAERKASRQTAAGRDREAAATT
jgi:hypothetical protein